ncbi:MAG: O-antigen ligase family protein [Chloroflexi bacterium]|nr:O-antigen ligase family protein [Chloroflexota bacterium]
MGKTVFKRITNWLTVEKVLLVWMSVVLVFTYSRSGYVTALIVIGVGVFFWLRNERLNQDRKAAGLLGKAFYKFLSLPAAIRMLLMVVILAGVFSAVLIIAGKGSNYISRMWVYWTDTSTEFETLFGSKSLGGYIRYIGFGPRFIYWETAYRIFLTHPFFGVGLGNYTFYFQDLLPSTHLGKIPELLKVLVPDRSSIITAKNYFARLLAETGLLGTAAFLSYLLSLVGKSIYSWMSKDPEEKFWGVGALLGLVAFLVNTFSFDSLAIPNPWILFGLITASYQYFNGTETKNKELSS